ncbi:MAG: hypothetical protein QM651_08690 [Rhodoblastus sp.]
MKTLLVGALALALAGCVQAQQAADWLASDKAQKVAANLETAAAAFDCGIVVSGAALSLEIARMVDAGHAAIDRAGKVHAVSTAVCAALGGPQPRAN